MKHYLRSQCESIPGWYLVGIIIVLLIASINRFSDLDRYSLWADELWGVMACSKGSWMAMIRELVFHDNHPPGYQTILYFVMQWFGRSDFIIRAPSAIAGALSVLLTLHMGRVLFNCRTALLAGLLVALSHQAIYYSQEARAYSLLMFACLASTFFFIRIFAEEKFSNWNLIFYAGSATVTIYLHYAGVVFILCQAVLVLFFLLTTRQQKHLLLAALFCFGIPLLIYSRWIPIVYHHITSFHTYWAEAPTIKTLYETYNLMLGNSIWISSAQIFFLITALLGVTYDLLHSSVSRNTKILLVFLFLSTAPILIFFIKSVISLSIYTHRHFIFIIPFVAILSAQQIFKMADALPSKRLAGLVCTVFIVVFVALQLSANHDVHTKLAKEDFRGAAKVIANDTEFRSNLARNQAVVIASHEFFYHYLWANHVRAPAHNSLNRSPDQERLVKSLISTQPIEVYFLQVEASYYTEIRKIFESAYQTRHDYFLPGIRVSKYSQPRSPQQKLTSPRITAL